MTCSELVTKSLFVYFLACQPNKIQNMIFIPAFKCHILCAHTWSVVGVLRVLIFGTVCYSVVSFPFQHR